LKSLVATEPREIFIGVVVDVPVIAIRDAGIVMARAESEDEERLLGDEVRGSREPQDAPAVQIAVHEVPDRLPFYDETFADGVDWRVGVEGWELAGFGLWF